MTGATPSLRASATPHGCMASPRTRSVNRLSRSMRSTRAPFAAMRADKEEPATPPPITIRSKFMFPLGKDNSQRYYFRGGRQIKRPRTEVRGRRVGMDEARLVVHLGTVATGAAGRSGLL